MQRTDEAEMFLEKLASLPLTWENVFRSPQYTSKLDKEVVDLLLVLRNKGILVSMKCQQEPEKRSGEELARWVHKSAKAGLKQVAGGIRTCKTREFWCRHERRGQVFFKANDIQPVRAVVIAETLEEVTLGEDMPLEIGMVSVSYLSVNDFLNVIDELRTFNDLLLYLEARGTICPRLQRTLGVEKDIFQFFVARRGVLPVVDSLREIRLELDKHKAEVANLVYKRKTANLQALSIEELSDRLSTRLETYQDGLEEGLVSQFDPASNRGNYLAMQDELCDLVLDERRKLGVMLSGVVEKVKEDDLREVMIYQAAYLDSKPDFLYVLSSSKGFSRNEVFLRCHSLLQGGLSFYGKKRGLAVNYTQERDGYETAMIRSFEETPQTRHLGDQLFANLREFEIPIDRV